MNLTAWVLTLACLHAEPAPKVVPLWSEGAPGALGTADADVPTLTVYLPPADKATGAGIILIPGGGYFYLTGDKEGRIPAGWLNERGIAAFVLKYRHAPEYRYPYPILDGKRAVRLVRNRARDYHLDSDRIGVWGFSAGGHLAATLATHFDSGKPAAADPVEREGCRPDFLILAYPVITMDMAITNLITRISLLGRNPDPKLVDDLSAERQVTAKTPPTFIFHAGQDRVVSPENSVLFYRALNKAGVPAELHLSEKGGHGVPLLHDDPRLPHYQAALETWLKSRGLFERAGRP